MRLAVAAVLFSLPLAAHALTLDDFTLIGEGHSITFSLPDTGITPDHLHGVTLTESASTTIDGVPGYTESATFYVAGGLGLPQFLFTVPSTIDNGELVFAGPYATTFTVIPTANPIPVIHPDDLLVTFVPGVYTYLDNSYLNYPPHFYTLTITPEATTAATPEPSSLVLLATGALGFWVLDGAGATPSSHNP